MVEQVKRISEDLENNVAVAPVTVREFLLWYGAERRGHNVVDTIRADLREHGILTVPDFEGSWLDGLIEFRKSTEETSGDKDEPLDSGVYAAEARINNLEIEMVDESDLYWIEQDPSHQISKLAAANQGVKSVAPNESLVRVVTIMMMHDFSQLPVMTGERSVRGVISWRSIGHHLSLKRAGDEVRHAMIPAQEVRHDASIFDVIGIISLHDYVLVRDASNKISGIVTATDLNQQFRNLSEPFLLIGEIENHIRNIIGEKIIVADLSLGKGNDDDRVIQGVSDLTFGEYVRLMEKPDCWAKLGLEIDRAYFCEMLEFVRKVRNDVMHFDPDGIKPDQVRGLREFGRALRVLRKN